MIFVSNKAIHLANLRGLSTRIEQKTFLFEKFLSNPLRIERPAIIIENCETKLVTLRLYQLFHTKKSIFSLG